MEQSIRKRIVGHDEAEDAVVLPIIKSTEIQIFHPAIGKGAFGQVYRGKCRGMDVAVKVLDGIEWDKTVLDEFVAEVGIMARLLHPNILLCMGACTEDEFGKNNFAIILEYMPRGDLNTIIHNQKIPLSLPKKMLFGLDICKGMAWLAAQNILHRDLKPANVLVDKNWTCKICDFGLSQIQRSKKMMRDEDEAPGSVLWMAPEVLLNEDIDSKLDVYAFALVFWEILTRKDLFGEYDDKDIFTQDVAIKGVRPSLLDIHPVLQQMLQRAWHRDPKIRPTFVNLVKELEQSLIEIYLPNSLCENAREFWTKYFPTRARVGWEEFLRNFFRTLGKRNGSQILCLEKMICENDGDEKFVSIESFSSLLKWFGKMKLDNDKFTIMDRVEKIMKAEYFFGPESSNSAEDKLILHKDKEGMFMVRLNLGTGSIPIETAPFTISRVEAGGKLVHTRVYLWKKGGLMIKLGNGAKIRNKSESLVDFIEYVKTQEPSLCVVPCPGWPYKDIFSALPRIKGPYEEASKSDDE